MAAYTCMYKLWTFSVSRLCHAYVHTYIYRRMYIPCHLCVLICVRTYVCTPSNRGGLCIMISSNSEHSSWAKGSGILSLCLCYTDFGICRIPSEVIVDAHSILFITPTLVGRFLGICALPISTFHLVCFMELLL